MDRFRVRKDAIRPLLNVSFPDYKGRTYRVEFTKEVYLSDTYWSGGTRSWYVAIQMQGGQVSSLPSFAPWDNPVEGKRVELPKDIVIAEHAYFCGKDMGVTFYAHPSRKKLLTKETN